MKMGLDIGNWKRQTRELGNEFRDGGEGTHRGGSNLGEGSYSGGSDLSDGFRGDGSDTYQAGRKAPRRYI
jgi:hypothetical protein